jgi:hypothetical protein
VPGAIARDRELGGKGLVTILEERQGATAEDLPGFVWNRFANCEARVCTGVWDPLPEFQGIPHAALIGVDGRLLWHGSPISGEDEMVKLIQGELQKMSKGWGDDADSRKIRAMLHGKADLAGSKRAIEALPEGPARTALQKELEHAFAWRATAVKQLQEQGRWEAARDLAADLRKGVAGVDEWVAKAAELLATFDTPDGKRALAADKKLQKVLAMIADGKLKGGHVKAIRDAVKSAEGTQVAARAERIAAAKSRPGD